MKKNLIALLLAVVMAAGSIGSVPVMAAETTAQEAEQVQEEADKTAEEEEVDVPAITEDTSEGETVQSEDEVSIQEEEKTVEETEQTEEQETAEGEALIEEEAGTKEEEVTDEDQGEETDEPKPEDIGIEDTEVMDVSISKKEGASAVVASGSCGNNAAWTLTGVENDYTLTISGSGEISSSFVPWLTIEVYQGRYINSVVIEDGITRFSDTFANLSYLRHVTIADTVEYIGEKAFYKCSQLESIKLPNGLTSIEYCTFSDCSSLTSVTIPDGVTSIMSYAFSGCSSLTSLTIPDSVTGIKGFAFSGCSNLTTLTIGNGVTSIEQSAFRNCSSLTSVTIPDSVTEIQFSVFSGCSNLTTLTIGNGLTSIGSMLFSYCSNLTSIYFSGNAPTFRADTFYDLTTTAYYPANDPTWTDDVRQDYDGTITWVPWDPMEGGAIADGTCGPDLLWALDNEGTLTISGTGGMDDYDYGSTDNLPPWHEHSIDIKRLVIQDGVTTIGNSAYSYCSNLTSITIPDSVTTIGIYAFSHCDSLASITIPGSVTTIGGYVFYDCTSLKSVYFTGDAPSFDSEVFGGDTSTVYYPENNVTWTDSVKQNYGGTITWVSWNPGGSFEPVEPALIRGAFKFRSGLKNDDSITYTFDYNDDWVFSSSASDRYKLMQTSIRVAMAAFGAKEDDWSGPANIKAMMYAMGFGYTGTTTETKVTDYTGLSIIYPRPVNKRDNTIGSAIGLKNIRQADGSFKSIILVAIRGGGYGAEWGDNFYVSDNEVDSAGFRIAADQVDNRLRSFVNENIEHISDDPYIWITGFSRAAATSNLVAADLINGTCRIDKVNPENVLAFCFECPKTTTDDNADNEMYGNILSIVNPLDFVPKVPFKIWGFTRYGYTAYLPSPETISSYSNKKTLAIEKYSDLFRYCGIPFNEMVIMEGIGQASLLDSFTDHLSFFISRALYTQVAEDGMIDVASSCLGNAGSPEWGTAIPSLINVAMTAIVRPFSTAKVVNLFTIDKDYGPGQNAHFPELCMSWIDAFSGFDNFFFAENSLYRTIFINCPVDVIVQNSRGNIVGRIENEEIDEIEAGIVTRIDEDGQKVLILPKDEEYSVKITAREDCQVSYTVTEYNFDSDVTEKVINYKNIEVDAGDELIGTATEIPEDEEAEYTLQYAEEEAMIEPDEILTDDEVTEYTVEIMLDGNGTVTGGGRYIKGEFAQATAAPDEGYVFEGWYSGDECVSKEAKYRFAVEADTVLAAVFSFAGDSESLENADISGVSNKTYTGKAVVQNITVKYNETVLFEDTDYIVSYTDNINVGKASVTITGIGSYTGTVTKTFLILPGASKKVTCTNLADCMKVEWVKVPGATQYKVYRDDELIKTTSGLVIGDKDVRYKVGEKFTYKVVATNDNAGDSPVSRTGTYYRLLPVGVKTLTSPSAGKLKVTYGKCEGCYGYVVRYGKKSDMSDSKTLAVKGANTLTKTLSVEKGKTYYVQVRTYMLVNGVRYFSTYSRIKSVKVK